MSLVARLSLVAAVLSGAVLVLLPAISLAADTHRVAVVDNAYDDGNRDGNAEEDDERRSDTLVTAGDTVVWEWEGDNRHTVTARADSAMPFDSDAECGEDKTPCQTEGNRFAVTFEEPGTYDYYCKFHSDVGLTGMTGTIEVQPAPEPSGSDSGSSEPSSEPSSEASSEPSPSEEESSAEPESGESSSPQEEPNPEPTSESASEPRDDPEGSSDGGGRPPRQADAPGFGVQDQPTDRGTRGLGPEVAPETAEGPTFSPFPSAPDLPSESETEDMAVNVPTRGGGPSRGAVVGVAIASVIGSAGVFGKVILFGQPWG